MKDPDSFTEISACEQEIQSAFRSLLREAGQIENEALREAEAYWKNHKKVKKVELVLGLLFVFSPLLIWFATNLTLKTKFSSYGISFFNYMSEYWCYLIPAELMGIYLLILAFTDEKGKEKKKQEMQQIGNGRKTLDEKLHENSTI